MLTHDRFNLYATQLMEYLNTKSPAFHDGTNVGLASLKIKAGLYKPSGLFAQHNLILASITGLAPTINSQIHGKRKRRTNSLTVVLYGKQAIWSFHDKFLHELVPTITEFGEWRVRKGKANSAKSINIRLRKKLGTRSEFANLVDVNMQDTHRGIYLPLTISLIFTAFTRYALLETYLRMIRLPMILFRYNSRDTSSYLS